MTMQSHAQRVHPANPAEVIANVAYQVLSFHQSRRCNSAPLHSEPRCPGNTASLRFHLIQRSRIIVPVVINHTGPYEFLLDTGAGSTIVDPALATELHLKTQGPAEVVGVGFNTHTSFAYLDLLEAGSHSVAESFVVEFCGRVLWSDGTGTFAGPAAFQSTSPV